MSSTAIEINAPGLRRPDAVLEAMPHPYMPAASWIPDPHHTQAQLHYDRQLPRPPNLENSGLDGRISSQSHSSQHQRPGGVFQSADMPSSGLHFSHGAAPLGLPSHQSYLPVADTQRSQAYNYSRISSLSSSIGDGPDISGGQQMSQSRKPSVTDAHSPSFAFVPRPQMTDERSHYMGHEVRQPDTVGAISPDSQAISPTELKHDPLKISDLLSPGAKSSDHSNIARARQPPVGDETRYRLKIRQQPVAARSCGFGERDRRVVDPPPIVQLIIEGPELSQDEISRQLRYCHYVMSCSIYDETGTRDASFMPEEYRQQRRLMGSLVGAPFVGKDEFGEEGCFFCFPDLSCRTPGSFRLKFNLVKIDPARAKELKHFPVLVEAKSEVFTVYTAKDFPGMQASTRLTKRLKEQGCIISIKKGNDRAKTVRTHDDSSEGELDEGESTSQGKRRRRTAQQ